MSEATLPVVLIPGFMLDETLWDDFVRLFPDDRAFIRASLTDGDSVSDLARNIVAHLPERFILAGFSLGGYVARAITELFPQRTCGLILIATSLQEDSPEQREMRRAGVRAAMAGDFNGLSSGAVKKALHRTRRDDKPLIAKIQQMGKRLGVEVLKNQSGLGRDHITLHPITCPVSVIAAQQDPLRSYQEASELAALTGSRVEVIEECGHMIPLEQPQELARRVSDWLRRVGL